MHKHKGETMKLLDVLAKEMKEWPEGMLYAVQDDDGEVKFGKHSKPFLHESGIWQRSHDGVCTTIHGIELAEDWDSAIVTKDMWENAKVKNESKHKHAEMIALCAEFAQTMEDPMTMFQRSYEGNMWIECAEVEFKSDWKYRLKPKN